MGQRIQRLWGYGAIFTIFQAILSGCAASEPSEDNLALERAAAHSCGSITLRTTGDYEAARECSRIDGDLTISADYDEDRVELPALTAVTGRIGAAYGGTLPHPLRELELHALREVGGSFELLATRIDRLELPELRNVGGALLVGYSLDLTTFEAPQLERVGGRVELASAIELSRLDLRNLTDVGEGFDLVADYELEDVRFDAIRSIQGPVFIDGVYRLSREDVEPLWSAGDGSRPLGAIDCCGDAPHGCELFSPMRCD